jgi:hypothetical protein
MAGVLHQNLSQANGNVESAGSMSHYWDTGRNRKCFNLVTKYGIVESAQETHRPADKTASFRR